jgi:hypothetical protein
MHYLFNSEGRYIANWIGNRLYTPSGKHIGHYLQSKTIFVDLAGHYLGEVVHGNRLMLKRSSPFRGMDFGRQREFGEVRVRSHPGHLGDVDVPRVYDDVPEERLRRIMRQEEMGQAEATHGEQLTGSSPA